MAATETETRTVQDHGTVLYVVAASTSDRRVSSIWESPVDYGKNPAAIGRTVTHYMQAAAEKFPYPEYDVVTARVPADEGAGGLERVFGEYRGFKQADNHRMEWR